MKYTRVGPDGSITMVEGFDIFDHVEQTVSEALAYTGILANQDPANQPVPYALHLNRQYMEKVCELLEFMTTEMRARLELVH